MFKLVPVTLTAAGIAGFILSLGMAVDANILIFERMKEEMKSGKTISDALENGFDRAWSSIRDGNISSMITAVILFWFGTALIKGFALTFGLGVLVSMVSAIIVSKVLLLSITSKNSKVMRFLFSNGITK
jgi:protein-export membrane protein SecD